MNMKLKKLILMSLMIFVIQTTTAGVAIDRSEERSLLQRFVYKDYALKFRDLGDHYRYGWILSGPGKLEYGTVELNRSGSDLTLWFYDSNKNFLGEKMMGTLSKSKPLYGEKDLLGVFPMEIKLEIGTNKYKFVYENPNKGLD